jgi:hypothetical protein
LSQRAASRILTAAACLCLLGACRTAPVPPGVAEALRLDETLGGAGASSFSADAYARFRARLADMKDEVRRQRARLGPWRDFRAAQASIDALLAEGNALLSEIHSSREGRRQVIREEMASLRLRRDRLQDMTGYFNDNEAVRKPLTQADIKLSEAVLLLDAAKFDAAGQRLRETAAFLREAEGEIGARLRRYLDPDVQRRWRAWADQTIAESRRTGGTAFLVCKIERTLMVVRRGAVTATIGIGLGKYGLTDKLYAGDEATPEGHYRITRKFPTSSFYKALLIDYPNAEDLRTFAEAKRQGLVPARVDAGGAIEIHGGGKDKLTKGCVGMENADMDEVYKAAEIGTPVTIVGALSVEGTILADIKAFEK